MTRSGGPGFSLAILCLLKIAVAAPAPERYFGFDQSAMRVFRRGETPVKTTSSSSAKEMECPYDVISQPGEYFVQSSERKMCTWLFLTRPSAVVELEIIEHDYPCAEDSFVEFFDGVALQMGVFPTETGHDLPLQERVNLVCSTGSRVLLSSQNVAMLTYQAPPTGGSFRLLFKHKTLQAPCNIFGTESSGAFTLGNFGKEKNCSFVAIYPGYINVLHMAVGRETNEARLKCKSISDTVQFAEGNSLEFGKMNVEQRMCGRTGGKAPATPDVADPSPEDPLHGRAGTAASLVYQNRAQCTSGITIPLMCQMSVVRLVSSGQYDNKITFTFTRETNEKNECAMF
ncbi:corticotropin-releasing factor-binding protein-like [Acanthaster planci]|uniref:Corticotropin-releasing factor-binding protein n=1 Tax=Acanthaster planci TaxID=133434 RepID=A0A8B7Y881_ACAPL|nr:corticotropin-releasing factor-binding protein-like [Acanthaster planci]